MLNPSINSAISQKDNDRAANRLSFFIRETYAPAQSSNRQEMYYIQKGRRVFVVNRISSNPVLSIIRKALLKQKKAVCLVAFLCVLSALLPSLTPLVYRQIVDIIIPMRDYRMLYLYVLALIAIPACTSLLHNLRNIHSYRLSDSLNKTLRCALFEKTLSLTQTAFRKFGANSLVYRVTRACGQIGDVFLNSTIISFVNSSLTLITVFIPMFALNWMLALSVLSAFPLVYLLLGSVKKHVRDNDKRLMDTLMQGEQLIHEAFAGIRVIKLNGGRHKQLSMFRDWLDSHTGAKLTSSKTHEFELTTLPEMCVQLLYGLIFILGALMVMNDRMTTGVLVAFIAYVPQAFSAIRSLLRIQVTYKSVEPTIMSVCEVFEAESEETGSLPAPAGGRISFRHVDFSYSKETKFALHDLNFEIQPGEAVAIVGETGGGKSTIFDLLLRMHSPSSGRIELDGTDICAIDLTEYRARFSVVQQDHFLWSDTLEKNITYPSYTADASKFDRAAEDAQLSSFIDGLPCGKDTIIGERGQAVSGGERQRISLAHALYQDRGILLLDEPTSALDASTEAAVRDMLLALHGKKTIISITHRLSTIMEYDRVLLLKDGIIAESGAPRRLCAQEGSLFRKMCVQQGLIA